MKIAMVSILPNRAAYGDAMIEESERLVDHLSAALSQAGHQVTVYVRDDGSTPPERRRRGEKYRVVRLAAGPRKSASAARALDHVPAFSQRLVEEWRRERPDIVHSHDWLAGMATMAAARDAGLPFVQSFHSLGSTPGPEHAHQEPAGRIRLEHAVAQAAEHTITTCADHADTLLRSGIPRDQVTAIPAGVDLARFRPHPDVPADGPILSLGALTADSGHDQVIMAMSVVPEAHLVIAGDPNTEPARRLRRLAKSVGVANRVRVTPSIDYADRPGRLVSSPVVVCPRQFDPVGLTTVEAMACGVPVVAMAAGAPADIIVPGVTGVLVPPGRPGSLAAGLSRLIADPMLRETYGVAAADRAHVRYGWDRIAEDVLRVYATASGVEPLTPTFAASTS